LTQPRLQHERGKKEIVAVLVAQGQRILHRLHQRHRSELGSYFGGVRVFRGGSFGFGIHIFFD
jgi:hypothetical protein